MKVTGHYRSSLEYSPNKLGFMNDLKSVNGKSNVQFEIILLKVRSYKIACTNDKINIQFSHHWPCLAAASEVW